MNIKMNKNIKYWLILIIVIVVALLTAIWAISHLPRPLPWTNRRSMSVRGDRELYYTVKTVLSMINVTLLSILLIIYIDMYKKTKSEFTIGLITFSLVLLLNALTSNPVVHWLFGFRAYGLGPFAMLPDLFTFAASIILLYLTLKY